MPKTISTKTAADDQLEGAFFQLAYQRLQDTLKNLIPYLVGFEIVKKNEENTKALGVFGFRSNNGQILFVPVFFINGKVKTLDLLYSKNNEQFYPLNEDFAEMFIKDEMLGLGENSEESRSDVMRDAAQGDYRQLVVPPRTGKYTVASVVDYVKSSDSKTKKAFSELIEKNAEFCESVLRFYPLEKIAEAISIEDGDKYRAGDNAPAKLRIVKKENKEQVKNLTAKQKETLLTQGFVIIDDRGAAEKSKFGATDYEKTFSNPTEPGFYSYVTTTGNLRYGLILVRPKQLQQNFSTDDSIVIDLESGKGDAYIKDNTKVFVKDHFKIDDYSTVHKMMVDAAEARPSSNIYVLVNENLKATQPFYIAANFKDASGIRRISAEPYRSYDHGCDCIEEYRGKTDRPGSVHELPRGNFYNHPKRSDEVFLVMTKKPGDKLEYKDNLIYVPSGYKLLKIQLATKHSNKIIGDSKDGDNKNDADNNNEPGSVRALHNLLSVNNILPMTVRTNGSEYFVDINGAKKKYDDPLSAKIAMTMEFGLPFEESEKIIDALIPGISKKGHIKLAYTGDMYPQPLEETPYTNEFGQPTTTGVGMENMLAPDISYTQDPTQKGLGVMPEIEGVDPRFVQQAIQLAQNNQKEIFDAHTIGALAKYVSVGDKISEYLPSIIEATDRLGRILFLLHWETDKFQDMYGRGDLPELVELVTSVFKNLGELVVFLKRKSPELSINMTKADNVDM
jgi:hypothetical protein